MPKQPLAAYVAGEDFGQQKVAFKVSGSWMMSEIGSDYADLLTKTGIGAFPNSSDADGRTATTLGNFKWVVDAKTKNAEAAGDVPRVGDRRRPGEPRAVLRQHAVHEGARCGSRCRMPSREDPAAADAPWSSVIVNDIAPDAIPEPTYPWDVSLAVGTAMESVMKGAASADDAIKTADGRDRDRHRA